MEKVLKNVDKVSQNTERLLTSMANSFGNYSNQLNKSNSSKKNVTSMFSSLVKGNKERLDTLGSVNFKERFGATSLRGFRDLFELNANVQEQMLEVAEESSITLPETKFLGVKDDTLVSAREAAGTIVKNYKNVKFVDLNSVRDSDKLLRNEIIEKLVLLRNYVVEYGFNEDAKNRYESLAASIKARDENLMNSLDILNELVGVLENAYNKTTGLIDPLVESKDIYPMGDYTNFFKTVDEISLKKVRVLVRSRTRNINDAVNKVHKDFRARVEKRAKMLKSDVGKLKGKVDKGEQIDFKESKELHNVFYNLHFFVMKNGKSPLDDVNTVVGAKLMNGDGAFYTKNMLNIPAIRTMEHPDNLREFIISFYKISNYLYKECEEMCKLVVKFVKNKGDAKSIFGELEKKADLLVKRVTIKSDLGGAILKRETVVQSDDWVDNWLDLFREFINEKLFHPAFPDIPFEIQKKWVDIGTIIYKTSRDEVGVVNTGTVRMKGSDICDDFLSAFTYFSRDLWKSLEENSFRARPDIKQNFGEKIRTVKDDIGILGNTINEKNRAFETAYEAIPQAIKDKNGLSKSYYGDSGVGLVDRLLAQELLLYEVLAKNFPPLNKIIVEREDSEFRLLNDKLVPDCFAAMSYAFPDKESELAENIAYLEKSMVAVNKAVREIMESLV